jgi:GNAT superfamily N-acetyltransferase
MTTAPATPERWARLVDERSPGLTWLAATLLEWSALLPAERRSWRVTSSAARGGAIQAMAALHEERGLMAIVSQPDAPTPFFGLPENVQRVLGDPAALEATMAAVPELESRRLLSVRRTVHVALGHLRARDPGLRRARDAEVADLEALRVDSGADPDPMQPVDLGWATLRGHVWVLEDETGLLGMFRVDGASLRHVQIADLVVPPSQRGRGHGTRLARAAAQVAREEFARDAVLAVIEGVAPRATLRSAGFQELGALDDVRLG